MCDGNSLSFLENIAIIVYVCLFPIVAHLRNKGAEVPLLKRIKIENKEIKDINNCKILEVSPFFKINITLSHSFSIIHLLHGVIYNLLPSNTIIISCFLAYMRCYVMSFNITEVMTSSRKEIYPFLC